VPEECHEPKEALAKHAHFNGWPNEAGVRLVTFKKFSR
jgi:hypothetical protein